MTLVNPESEVIFKAKLHPESGLVACLCILQYTEGKSEKEDINGKVKEGEAWKDSIVLFFLNIKA